MPSPLRSSLLALAVVGVGSAILSFLYGRHVAHDDRMRALSKVRRALKLGLPPVYLVGLLALAAVDWFGVVDRFVASMARYLFGGLLVFVALLLALSVLTTGALAGSAGVALLTIAFVLGIYAGTPLLVRIVRSTREPTDAERDRLTRLREAAGLDYRETRVIETGGTETALAIVRGVPGRRSLFVTDHLLGAAGDDVLGAILAMRAGRVRVRHFEARFAVLLATGVGVLAPGFSLPIPGVPDFLATPIALVVGGVLLRVGRRLVFRADEYAADRVGADRVRAAIEWTAEGNDLPLEFRTTTELWAMTPSPASRLDRLRERG